MCLFSDNDQLLFGPWSMLAFNWMRNPTGVVPRLPEGMQAMLLVTAEKDASSTNDVQPVQSVYRDKEYFESTFWDHANVILGSPRPFCGNTAVLQQEQAYVSCGSAGLDLPF